MNKPPQMVLVVWEDAKMLDAEAWVANTPIKETKPCIIHTVGFLFHADEERMVLVESWNEDITGPRQQIPRGMVRSVHNLKKGR